MKDLKDAIYEASKQLKAAKFENIPAKDLYSELVKAIQKAYEKDIINSNHNSFGFYVPCSKFMGM